MKINESDCRHIANRMTQRGLADKLTQAYSDASQISTDFLSVLDAVIGFSIKGRDEAWMTNKALAY